MSHKYSYSRNKHTHWFLFRFLQAHHKPYQRHVFLILTLSLTPVIFRTDHKILSLKIPSVLVRTWKNVPHNSGIPSTHTHTFKISCIEQRIINLSSNNTSKKKKKNKTRESRCHRVSCWIWTWTESNHCCPRQGKNQGNNKTSVEWQSRKVFPFRTHLSPKAWADTLSNTNMNW